jgi:hypothetical protein
MDDQAARKLALGMPEATEKSHFGNADFRVRNKIFMSLPEPGRAVVKLTREQQEVLCGAEPAIFVPVKGGWGRQGWTSVMLAESDETTLHSAIRQAWLNVAPAKLRKAEAPHP